MAVAFPLDDASFILKVPLCCCLLLSLLPPKLLSSFMYFPCSRAHLLTPLTPSSAAASFVPIPHSPSVPISPTPPFPKPLLFSALVGVTSLEQQGKRTDCQEEAAAVVQHHGGISRHRGCCCFSRLYGYDLPTQV